MHLCEQSRADLHPRLGHHVADLNDIAEDAADLVEEIFALQQQIAGGADDLAQFVDGLAGVCDPAVVEILEHGAQPLVDDGGVERADLRVQLEFLDDEIVEVAGLVVPAAVAVEQKMRLEQGDDAVEASFDLVEARANLVDHRGDVASAVLEVLKRCDRGLKFLAGAEPWVQHEVEVRPIPVGCPRLHRLQFCDERGDDGGLDGVVDRLAQEFLEPVVEQLREPEDGVFDRAGNL